jgi:signal transduction histidine kinase
MNEKEEKRRKINFWFTLSAVEILLGTVLLSSVFIELLAHFNIIPSDHPIIVVLIFAFSCVVIGSIGSRLIGEQLIRSVEEITRLTREVASGNYEIQLKKDYKIREMNEMMDNFNTMTRQLSSTEILRSDFISNVSHEFKTPLSAIEGYATLLQNPNLTEEQNQVYTANIIRNTRRLSTLTGNILQLSQLDTQEKKLETEVFSLDEQLREAVLLFEGQWSEKNLDLDIDLDPVEIEGNPELLAQVWQNLIGNAIKFGHDCGLLRVRLRQEEPYAVVSVEDDGIGMEEQTRQRIFEKFYQGETSHSAEGNGLGLALVQKIVTLHGGEVTVESQIDNGSVFTVKLPIKGV